MDKKWKWALAVTGIVGVLGFAIVGRGQFSGSPSALAIDLSQPDAYLESRQLSALPAELVRMPGLSAVLTPDFVNYYEEHPDRLTLDGTLRRLAFENKLSWQDKIIAALLNAPAQAAFWRDGKGRLAYFALVLQKNTVASVMEQVAKATLPDSQLQLAGEVSVGGKKVQLYALKTSTSRTWVFASLGERLLVISHAAMVLGRDGKPASRPLEIVQKALDASQQNPWQSDFMLPPQAAEPARHALALKASYLSFGYQYYFPQLGAIQLAVQPNLSWKIQVAASASAWTDWPETAKAAWASMPHGASFCTALPLAWERAEPALRASLGDAAKSFAADLLPGAGLCWYSQAGLYAPLISLRMKPGTSAKHDTSVKALLAQAVKTAAKKPQGVAAKALPNQGLLATRNVASTMGYTTVNGERTHRVAIARMGDTLVASVDHRLVDSAVAVANKTFPALADDHAGGPLLLAHWADMARTLDQESQRLATRTAAPVFSGVTREQLKPRLEALARNGALALRASASATASKDKEAASAWVWQPLAIDSSNAGAKK